MHPLFHQLFLPKDPWTQFCSSLRPRPQSHHVLPGYSICSLVDRLQLAKCLSRWLGWCKGKENQVLISGSGWVTGKTGKTRKETLESSGCADTSAYNINSIRCSFIHSTDIFIEYLLIARHCSGWQWRPQQVRSLPSRTWLTSAVLSHRYIMWHVTLIKRHRWG